MYTKSIKKKIINKDIYRYYGKSRLTLKEKILMVQELKYIIIFRKMKMARNRISKIYYKIRLKIISDKTKIQIPYQTKIGEGFYIGHCGRIIINPKVTIGKNVNIATGIVIGQTNRGLQKGVPRIGDNVWIGANVVIVGNITIGNNVLIAPNSYVNFDVPNNSVVIGNPGIIKHKNDATKEYINRCI